MPSAIETETLIFSEYPLIKPDIHCAIAPAKSNPIELTFRDILTDLDTSIISIDLKQALPLLESIADIEQFYTEAPAAELTESEGFSSPKIIEHLHLPLHFAARDGDVEAIKYLIEDGYDINTTDTRSVTALHVAALFGQLAAVKTLVALGAKVDAKGYEDHTPLQFALAKHHYNIAKTLIIDNGASLKEIDYNGINGFTILFDDLTSQIESYENKYDPKILKKINQIVNLVESIVLHVESPYLYTLVDEIDGERFIISMPIELVLKLAAAYSPTPEINAQMLNLVNKVAAVDKSGPIFLNAKNLLHMFPNGEIYKLNIGAKKEIWIQSEGHFGPFTAQLASSSINTFIESDKFDRQDPLKFEIFKSLQSIYNNAQYFGEHLTQDATAQLAWELYEQGQTVLLTSGWEGHFIDIILSKPNELYVVANSGDRYHGESPEFEPDSAGLVFYRLQEPDRIDPQFMYNILTNEDRGFLEIENAYEYGVFEKIDDIVRDNQEFGNCGWESHRDAIEGILYIELLNQQVSPVEAKSLANEYYHEWDSFHGHYVIDQYMANSPGLPLKAMIDIIDYIHQKDYYTQADHEHAQKIADALVSPHYIEEFKSWFFEEEHDLADRLLLNILQNQHDIDIYNLGDDQSIDDNVSIQSDNGPDINVCAPLIEVQLTANHESVPAFM